jgi:hypothetical protein
MKKTNRLDIVKTSSDEKYRADFHDQEAIVIWIDNDYSIAKLFFDKLDKYIDMPLKELTRTNKKAEECSLLGDSYEISSDLILSDDMEFFEGTFRIPGEFWKIILVHKGDDIEEVVSKKYHWETGIEAIEVNFPECKKVNLDIIINVLGKYYPGKKWELVHGPDSMTFR